MFGADNCRASVAHPGAQLATAGGLARRRAYQSAHLGPAGVENFHYTPFQNTLRFPARNCQVFLLKSPPKLLDGAMLRGHNYFGFAVIFT